MFSRFLDVDFRLGNDGSNKTFICSNIFALRISVHKLAFLPLAKTTILPLFVHLGAAVRDGVVHDLRVGAVGRQLGAQAVGVGYQPGVLAGDGARRLLDPVRPSLSDPDLLTEIAERAEAVVEAVALLETDLELQHVVAVVLEPDARVLLVAALGAVVDGHALRGLALVGPDAAQRERLELGVVAVRQRVVADRHVLPAALRPRREPAGGGLDAVRPGRRGHLAQGERLVALGGRVQVRGAGRVAGEGDVRHAAGLVLAVHGTSVLGAADGVHPGVEQREVPLVVGARPVAQALERDVVVLEGAAPKADVHGVAGGAVVQLRGGRRALLLVLQAVVDVVREGEPAGHRAVLLEHLLAVLLLGFVEQDLLGAGLERRLVRAGPLGRVLRRVALGELLRVHLQHVARRQLEVEAADAVGAARAVHEDDVVADAPVAPAPDGDVVRADVDLRVLDVAHARLRARRALELQLHHELALQLRGEVAARRT